MLLNEQRRQPVLVAVEILVLVVEVGLQSEDVAVVGDPDSECPAGCVQERGNGLDDALVDHLLRRIVVERDTSRLLELDPLRLHVAQQVRHGRQVRALRRLASRGQRRTGGARTLLDHLGNPLPSITEELEVVHVLPLRRERVPERACS